MAHQPGNYQALRDDHARAMDALNNHIEPTEGYDRQNVVEANGLEHSAEQSSENRTDTGPTRPEHVHRSSPGWSQEGGMAQQQASAISYNNWIVVNNQEMGQAAGENVPNNIEQDAKLDQLDQHIDGQERTDNLSESVHGHPGQDAANSALEQHVENQDQRQPENAPAVAAAWDAWEAHVGQDSPGQDAANEALDRHIDSPDLQSDVQQQPGPEIEV